MLRLRSALITTAAAAAASAVGAAASGLALAEDAKQQQQQQQQSATITAAAAAAAVATKMKMEQQQRQEGRGENQNSGGATAADAEDAEDEEGGDESIGWSWEEELTSAGGTHWQRIDPKIRVKEEEHRLSLERKGKSPKRGSIIRHTLRELPGGILDSRIYRNSHKPEVVAQFTLGDRLNGHDHIVHGGLLATLADETFGMLFVNEDPGALFPKVFTAYLTLQYKALVHENQTVYVRARVENVERRKFLLQGTIEKDDGTVLAESESLFILARGHDFEVGLHPVFKHVA